MRIASEILLAALNSLWQAALVAGAVWLTLRLLRRGGFQRINAATRYAIWWAVLGVTLALPAAPAMVTWWHARQRPPLEAGSKVATPRPTAAPAIEESPAIVTLKEERAARWPAWVLAAWAALCLYRLFQIGRSYVYLRGVKRRASVSQAAMPSIRRSTRLLLSSEIASPMAVGFLHPAVILPESLPDELAQPEMEHVLLHEAAHIARKDDWTNLLARLLGAALALHPVAWWILRRIEREREIACDDWVVARTGSARPYAQSLARVSELRWSKKDSAEGEALASGIFGGGSRLGERIEMLLVRGRDFSARASTGRVAASAVLLLGCVIAGSLAPQVIAFAQERSRPTFEVASIRPDDGRGNSPRFDSAGITFNGVALTAIIGEAYNFPYGRIAGPNSHTPEALWSSLSTGYDIVAKAQGATSKDQLRLMLQSLLADRFKLTLHFESITAPVYKLMVAKSGPKFDESDTAGVFSMSISQGSFVFHNTEMMRFIGVLQGHLDRPVMDSTGLKGMYDFTLKVPQTFSEPEAAPRSKSEISGDWISSSLFTDLQKIGLQLVADKGPVEYLVVDHVEKPDAN
jgi:bla regulator protein BlaR1